VNFKFLGTTIGPVGSIGETSDEVYGGENNSFYGGGIKGDILLVPSLKLVLSPSLLYKHYDFDNWTYCTDGASCTTPSIAGPDRIDDDIEIAINAKMMFTKNFGWGAGYANSHVTSNFEWTGLNYNEEIYSTTFIFTF